MAHVFNDENLVFTKRMPPIAEYAWRSSQDLSKETGARNLKFDMRILEPGCYSFPYHFHRNAEEMFIIQSGEATLRTPEGMRRVQAGDVIYFEIGEMGAHQLFNHTEAPCRYLDIRTDLGLDVCVYPDSGKVNILPAIESYCQDTKVGYWTGEELPAEHWLKASGPSAEDDGE